MRNEFDIVVYSSSGQLVLVVEVKSLKQPSEEAAAFFRGNLVSHGLLRGSPYLLLAYRDNFFLWRGSSKSNALPDYKSSAKPVLKKYLGAIAETERGPGPEGMESAVKLWLSELANGIEAPDTKSETDRMLIDSGLLSEIRGGEVRRELFK